MDFTVEDLSIQLGDLKTALNALSLLSFVDADRTGVPDHSSGAVVALWFAAREPRVQAVVGLDGSVNRGENLAVFRRGLGGRMVSAAFLNICR